LSLFPKPLIFSEVYPNRGTPRVSTRGSRGEGGDLYEDSRKDVENVVSYLLPQLPTLEEVIRWGGYVGLFAIVFSETGLLVGFFLPGDSLLVTAGLFAARGQLDIFLLPPLLCVAAIAGNSTGYFIGHKAGQALYNRSQSRWFRRDHLIKTKEFYEKYGPVTIVLAQFMPFARTFAPVVAGIGEMRYRRFAMFNVVGAICWIHSMIFVGYFLGRSIPGIERHIEYVIAVVIFISISPLIFKYLQHRSSTRKGTQDPAAPGGGDAPPR
jgi:membrane-associated protein